MAYVALARHAWIYIGIYGTHSADFIAAYDLLNSNIVTATSLNLPLIILLSY